MTFLAYMKTQVKRNDHVGDLARDLQDDKDSSRPRGRASYSEWRSYFTKRNACAGALDALRNAWQDYSPETLPASDVDDDDDE